MPGYILLLEDDRSTANLIKMLLEWEGQTVRMARDLKEVTEVLGQYGQPTTALLDYYLETDTCESCAEKIRKIFPDTELVLMTAGLQPEQLADRIHAHRFVVKPFEVEDFVHKVLHR